MIAFSKIVCPLADLLNANLRRCRTAPNAVTMTRRACPRRTALCAQRATVGDRTPQSTATRSPGPRHTHDSRVKFRQMSVRVVRGKNMRQAVLLNPFNSNSEPAQIVNRRATRSTPVCSNCQSDDIISHAIAQWSNEAQEWQLASTFDRPAHCNGCNRPCGIVWLPLN